MGSWLGSLSIDDWRRQRERQKAIGLDWQNKQLCTCITPFLYISLPSLQDYDVKIPNFTFSRGREHKTTTSFFFSWTMIQSFRIQLQKNKPKKNADIWWTERDGISAIKFFWLFRSHHRRCCLSSLIYGVMGHFRLPNLSFLSFRILMASSHLGWL